MEEQTSLRTDLISLEPGAFYLKHIVKSRNWYFSHYLCVPPDEIVDRMDYFKEIVSSHLGISFHSLQIVGSAKIGYSLSPRKVLRPFHDGDSEQLPSDIDIAIISDKLYHKFWERLRKAKGIWHMQPYYQRLTESIFRGYINEKDLIKIDGIRREWEELCNPINRELQDKLRFIHPITYRVYRDWDDLEEYQIKGIEKAKNALEGNEHV